MNTGVDTLKLYERFRLADLNDKAAKEIAEAIKEAEQSRLDDLATKRDLAEMKVDLLKWVIGLLIAQSAFIAALFKLLK